MQRILWFWLGIVACSSGDGTPTTDKSTGDGETDTPAIDTIDTFDTGTAPRDVPWDCYGRGFVDSSTDGVADYWIYDVYDPQRPDLRIHYETDEWDDGSLLYVSDTAYDERGNAILSEIDDDADGTLDWIETWSYDDGDRELQNAVDSDADGAPDWIGSNEYDPDGELIHREIDEDGDGSPELIYDYQRVGGLLLEVLEDSDADGVADVTYTYTYDLQERLEGIVGVDDGGTTTYQLAYSYLDANDSYLYELDDDGDGGIEQRVRILRDDQGRSIEQHFDEDDDQHFEESWRDLVWDDDERFVSGEYVLEEPGGGAQDRWTYDYQYENPTGPWISVRVIDYRQVEDGPVLSRYTEEYDWTCP